MDEASHSRVRETAEALTTGETYGMDGSTEEPGVDALLESDEGAAAFADAWRWSLEQAQALGASRERIAQAEHRAGRLRAEIETLRDVGREARLAPLLNELGRFRSELDQARAQHQTTLRAIETLRREHTAALAGLARPGPVQGPPAGTPAELVADYTTLSRSGLMDAQWYRRRHDDVAQTGADPVLHYLEHGWREGRRPGPAFDGAAYLAANPELSTLGVNPLVHYHARGAFELRPTLASEPPLAEPATAAGEAIPASRPAGLKIVADLHSYEEFKDFRRRQPAAFDPATEETVKTAALKLGVRTEFLGELGPEATWAGPGDLREYLISGGLNSRQRAVADLLLEELDLAGRDPESAVIYGHEAVTPMAAMVRSRFPGFIGTEYAPGDEGRRRLLPYVHNDICASQFPDDSFDATFSCDVFEHVHDRDAALRETARTTKPKGVFLATFPFFFEMEVGAVFAEVVGGELRHHLQTPIYHGNPVDEDGGALVFEIPGWDIIERARRAGFSKAAMRFVCDEEKAITASGEGQVDGPRGVFVLVAHK